MEENRTKSHNLIIENRKKFTFTGVKDVLSFDDETIMLETELGRLAIKGNGLKISGFDNGTTDLSGEGRIHAVIYTAEEKNGSFISRLFR